MDIPSTLNDILAKGCEVLELDVGIVSNIVDETYTIFSCHNGKPGMKAGIKFELSNTYCSDVINQKTTKYYDDVANITGMLKHPCYIYTQLRAYIATPLIVNGRLWGTLNYSSLLPRSTNYSAHDVVFLESQAREVETILERVI